MKNIQNFFLNNDLSSSEKELYDNNQEFILQFEKSLTDKKKKSKVTGLEKFLEENENAT
jgi:hypothetical protein